MFGGVSADSVFSSSGISVLAVVKDIANATDAAKKAEYGRCAYISFDPFRQSVSDHGLHNFASCPWYIDYSYVVGTVGMSLVSDRGVRRPALV